MMRHLILLVVSGLTFSAYADGSPGKNRSRPTGPSPPATAQELLLVEIPGVARKKNVPPSGDKRDYQSLSVYWWPNPINGGKPYVYLDGKRNPAAENTDSGTLARFATQLAILTDAFVSTDDQRYATVARSWLRAWFLDPATRMNPNLKYAQAVPGWMEGTPMGVLEGLPLTRTIPKTANILLARGKLSDEEYLGIKEWFGQYVNWLENSPHGKYLDELENNHATWYDVQRVSCYLFLGNRARAREILGKVGERRIARQIQADGKQPAELARARPFEYSCYNLDAFLTLCEMGADLDVDVWGYATPSGASIGKALDFLKELTTAHQPADAEAGETDSLRRLLLRADAISRRDK